MIAILFLYNLQGAVKIQGTFQDIQNSGIFYQSLLSGTSCENEEDTHSTEKGNVSYLLFFMLYKCPDYSYAELSMWNSISVRFTVPIKVFKSSIHKAVVIMNVCMYV